MGKAAQLAAAPYRRVYGSERLLAIGRGNGAEAGPGEIAAYAGRADPEASLTRAPVEYHYESDARVLPAE